MSLHRTVNIVTCFHIHSFVVFHTLNDDTIVTCMLTARDHILSNMQDRVLQIMQLIQFGHSFKFLVTITNNFIGDDVDITKWSLAGYKAMGFDVTPLTQDTNQNRHHMGTVGSTGCSGTLVRGSNPSGARVRWNEGCAESSVGGSNPYEME